VADTAMDNKMLIENQARIINSLGEKIKEQENDLRIMFNRCEATAKALTSGGACKRCGMKEKCKRLTKLEG